MAQNKYKICPSCGEQNPPSLLECRKCETDLTGVKVVAGPNEINESTDEQSSRCVDAGQLYRVCDCGTRNPPQARKCQACGESIPDIMPTAADESGDNRFSYRLVSVDGEDSITIDKPVIIVGRDAVLKERLTSKAYVSRQHAKLTIVAGKVFIENLSQTNKTYVNNKPIDANTPVPICDGDEIGLGGIMVSSKRQENAAYFVVRTIS